MKRLFLAVVALVVLVAAASPSEVAPVLEAQGFFVEAGSNADPDAVEDAVVAARFEGGALSIAVLASEPAGGPTIFAENTLDEMPLPSCISFRRFALWIKLKGMFRNSE